MALSTSATESLLQAVDIIASSKLGEVSYDQTIICTIVDNSEIQKRGFYTVSDGKVRFKAYTDVTDYKIGDQIRVTIPNGDFNAKKYVDGLCAKDDDSTPITYVSSLDSFLNMADLILSTDNVYGELKANNIDLNNPNGIPIWHTVLDNDQFIDLQQNGIYDAMGLSADFKCLLGNYEIKSGNYGLRLDVKIKLNTLDNYVIKTFYLDSSEMFGNPYNFIAPASQSKMFNITSLGTVSELTLYFYQNNNFTYYNPSEQMTKSVPVTDYNIKVENVRLSFGTNIANIEDNTLKIYSLQKDGFNYINPTDSSNQKQISILWYNKNELNQYLGFSDGIVDFYEDGTTIKHYDEIEYLINSKKSARLASQVGKENIPKDEAGLQIAALVDESFQFIEELKVLLNNDLFNLLDNYRSRFATNFPAGAAIISGTYLNWLKNTYIPTITTDFENRKVYFENKLNYVSKINDYENPPEDPGMPEEPLAKLVDSYRGELNNKLYYGQVYASEISNLVSQKEYECYKGSYDSFVNQLSKIISLIDSKFSQIYEKCFIVDQDSMNAELVESTELEKALAWYKPGLNTGIYVPIDESQYANRYCIYWYRYSPGYVEPFEDRDFGGPEWERIKPGITGIQVSSLVDDIESIKDNLGLPQSYKESTSDGNTYWDKKPTGDYGLLKVYLDPMMSQEKYKVVLFYNHEKFESEPIVFSNLDDLNGIKTDKNGALSIEHMEGSSDTYQSLYGKNSFLLNAANAKRNRAVKAVYNGTLGNTQEVLLDGNAQICWYIPRENTMLNVDSEYLSQQGFTTNYIQTFKFRETIWEKLQKIIKILKEKYGENNYGRYLQMVQDKPYVSNKDNKTIQKYDFTELDFGNKQAFSIFKRVGNYLSLEPNYSMKSLSRNNGSIILGGQWLPIMMRLPKLNDDETDIVLDNSQNIVLDEETEIIEEIKSEFDREGYYYFYKQIDQNEINDTYFYYQIKNYFQQNEANNKIICVVKKDEEEFEASLNITFGSKDSLGSDYNFIVEPAGLAAAVKEDNPLQINISLFDYNNKQIPIYEYEYESESGSVYLKKDDKSAYCEWIGGNGAYSLDVKQNETNQVIGGEITCNGTNGNTGALLRINAKFRNQSTESAPEGTGNNYKKKELSDIGTFFSIPYSPGDYYIEGATSVIYDNSGNNPEYYKDVYNIFNRADGQRQLKVIWSINYYSYDGNNFVEVSNKDDIAFCKNYLPVLSDRNTIIPCTTFLDSTATKNYYAFIQCRNSETENLMWSQPIIVMKNRYATSMLNEADSTLAINTKSGSVLNSMMSAFKRTGSDGKSIDGFLIGEMQYSGESNKHLGMFGFTDGLQSFAFKMNGDVSIGMPDSGQINFTSGTGIISSTSSKGDSESGLTIDLQDGIIDIFSAYKKKNETTAVDAGKGIFGTSYTRQSYSKPGASGSSGVFNSHVKINAASSKSSEGFVQAADKGQFPSWWEKIPSWISRGGSNNKSRAVTIAADDNDNSGDNAIFLIEVPSPGNTSHNKLISIGDDQCIIQSNNYVSGNYDWSLSQGTGDIDAEGMKIDLQYGFIDAYKLKISSNNILINSSGDTDPLFVVRASVGNNNYKNLLYIKDIRDEKSGVEENTQFYIRSKTYEEDSNGKQTAGMQINVTDGDITSFNFNLRGEATNDNYAGSYILMTSEDEINSEPLFRFHLQSSSTGSEGLNLIEVSPTTFVLNSPTYKAPTETTKGEGLQLNLGEGKIISYNFSLHGESESGYIYLASNHGASENQQGVPMIQLQQKNKNSSINLLTVSPNEFIFMSPNYGGDEIDKDNSGLKLDIIQGYMGVRSSGKELLSIDNDSFILTSPTFNDGIGINLDIFNGALEVKNNGVSLMSISNTKDNQSFMLTSANFLNENGKKDKGMQIDVLKGSIEVRHNIDRTLLYINPEPSDDYPSGAFFLKSQDWQDSQNTGMQIDLMSSMIIMRQSGSKNQLILNASDTLYPLQIGTKTNEDSPLRFKVGWDGTIYVGDRSLNIGTDDNGNLQINGNTAANSFTASGDITVGGQLSVTGDVILSSDIELGGNLTMGENLTVSGYLISPQVKGSLTVLNNNNEIKFAVTNGGAISGSSLDVSGAIQGTSLSVGSGAISGGIIQGTSLSVSGAISGGTISGTTLNVGSGTISGGTISGTALDVSGAIQGASLSVSGAISGGSISGTALDVKSGAISGGTIQGTTLSVSGAIQGTTLNMSGVASFGKSITINGDNSLTSITFGLGNVKNSLAFIPVKVELKTIEIDGTYCQVYVQSNNNSSSNMYLYCST